MGIGRVLGRGEDGGRSRIASASRRRGDPASRRVNFSRTNLVLTDALLHASLPLIFFLLRPGAV